MAPARHAASCLTVLVPAGSPQSLDDPMMMGFAEYPTDFPGPVSTYMETMQKPQEYSRSQENLSSAYIHQPPTTFEKLSKRARVDSKQQMEDLGIAPDGPNMGDADGQQQYGMSGSLGGPCMYTQTRYLTICVCLSCGPINILSFCCPVELHLS